MEYLTPHTPEWFSALELSNSPQAAMTKQIVALAKQIEVCSICRDQPANDYEIVGVQFSTNVGVTIRLRDARREIRTRTREESFEPFD